VLAYGNTPAGLWSLALRPFSGEGVLLHRRPGEEQPRLWHVGSGGKKSDAPQLPSKVVSWEEAMAVFRALKAPSTLPRANPIVMRGQWTGHLVACPHGPVVKLQRRIVTYGVLHVTSVPHGDAVWAFKFERGPSWFAKSGERGGTERLVSWAVDSGIRAALGLIQEACALRDQTRRAALDTSYGAKHPIKQPREPRDPTDRLAPPKPKKKAATTTTKTPGERKHKHGRKPMTDEEKQAWAAKMRAARAAKTKQPAAAPEKPAKKPRKTATPAGKSKDEAMMAAFQEALGATGL
jgi:hypothetical protein